MYAPNCSSCIYKSISEGYTLKGICKIVSFVVWRKALKGYTVSWQTVRVATVILLHILVSRYLKNEKETFFFFLCTLARVT